MTEHRASYWKTAASAVLVVVAGVSAIGWLAVERFLAKNPWPLLANLAWWSVCVLLTCGVAVSVLVAAGALISLHRDNCENHGVPYAGRPREWHGGFVVRGLRTLLRSLRFLLRRRPGQLDLRAGELVEVRSREEIFATLDSRGEMDCLPFMPEMEAWYGQRACVFRRVDKIFDWITVTGLRRMRDTVILQGLRCDGVHHGGCQADCPILWKEAWLRRVSTKQKVPLAQTADGSFNDLDLNRFTTRIDAEASERRFVCQLCRLPQATTPTPWNNPRNLLRELLSGNVRLGPFFALIAILAFNAVQKRRGGALFPILAHSQSPTTPHATLNIGPGELVRIKTKHEIEQTLNSQFKNRGLWFDKEMTRFCGGTYKVRARVNRQIDERTGKMITITTPCITLEGVTATGEYFEFAPLDERIYWREIWLERAEPAVETKDEEQLDLVSAVEAKETSAV